MLQTLLKTIRKHPAPLIIVLTSVVMASAFVGGRSLGWLQSLELMIYDRLIQLRLDRSPNEDLLIVGITEADLRHYGWPLSDRVLARGLATLQRHQPRVIGLDLYRELPVGTGYEELVEQLKAPNLIVIEDVGAEIPAPPTVPLDRIGFNDLVLDPDGVARRGFLFVPAESQAFYAFSLRLALSYLAGTDDGVAIAPLFDFDADRALIIGGKRFKRLHPQAGGYENIDDGGYQILLDYHSRQNLAPQVSFIDVLNDRVPDHLIRDRLVVIGSVAPSLKDGLRTPYSSSQTEDFLMPGVLVHAQIINHLLEAILENRQPLGYWPERLEWLWIAVWTGLGGGLAWWRQRPLFSGGAFVASLVALIAISYGLFLGHFWLPLVAPVLSMTIVFTAVVGYRAYQFQQQQQIVMRLLGQNTSPEIAQALWESRDRLLKSGKLPGQRLIATMMFADIRNFSTTAESMTPEALMDWLNACLEPVTEAIQHHDGIVNKFTGDGFMAVFGLPMARVPAEVSQDAQQAVACALDIAKRLRSLNQLWHQQHLPLMQMRIGIFTGPVTAGSLGGKDRMEYGILGDSVNIASRLEGCAKERHIGTCRILIGQDTCEHLDGLFKLEDWGPMALKGKAQLVNVYRVIDLEDPEESDELGHSEHDLCEKM